jgi:polyhydroxyalkanoate synthesis regulator phasin
VRGAFAARAEDGQHAPRSLLTWNAEMIKRMQIEKQTTDEIRAMIDNVKGRIEEVDGEIEQLRRRIAAIEKAPAGDKAWKCQSYSG